MIEKRLVAPVERSPLGAGFLTGTVGALADNGFRLNNPRYAGENSATNVNRFAPLVRLAEEKGVTPARLALA